MDINERLSESNSAVCLGLGSLIALGGLADASAQSIPSSSLVGAVHDSAGAAVVGVEVTIKNLTNDTKLQTVSDATGGYSVEGLIPVSYEVTAAKYGFRESKTRLVVDAAGRQFRTDLKLKIADVNETAANFSSMQLEDAVTMRFQAMEARIEQLETELACCHALRARSSCRMS